MLDERVVIVTGAGRGLGRAYARFLAGEGARVVVNDLGGDLDGSGSNSAPAEQVVAEIHAQGGEAVAHTGNVADPADARAVVATALEHFGRLDVLVNNAGILRDSFLHQSERDDWQAVLDVHLGGHYQVLREAVRHWRSEAKAGRVPCASVINTTSDSGTVVVIPGQAAYGAAKAAIAALTMVAAEELGRIGVRVNAIAPGARTRMTESTPGEIGARMRRVVEPGQLDEFSPDNVAPFVAYLAAEDTPVTGRVFGVRGGLVREYQAWAAAPGRELRSDVDWTVDDIARGLAAWHHSTPQRTA